MSWIYRKNPLEESGCSNMNLLYNVDKFYIMDNHLAAAWCWTQKIDTSKKYGLFHIDRHYDLLNNLGDDYINANKDLLISNDFNAYYSLKDNYGFSVIRFDNYIDTFNRLFPKLIQKIFFATHNDGSDEQGTSVSNISNYKPEIWDLQSNIKYWITESNNEIDKWIVNLDLDYFFQDFNNEENSQFLTKKYIRSICREIKQSLSKIDVVTIALSPEFCNGWGNSFHVLRIICNELGIEFPYTYKRFNNQSHLLPKSQTKTI